MISLGNLSGFSPSTVKTTAQASPSKANTLPVGINNQFSTLPNNPGLTLGVLAQGNLGGSPATLFGLAPTGMFANKPATSSPLGAGTTSTQAPTKADIIKFLQSAGTNKTQSPSTSALNPAGAASPSQGLSKEVIIKLIQALITQANASTAGSTTQPSTSLNPPTAPSTEALNNPELVLKLLQTLIANKAKDATTQPVQAVAQNANPAASPPNDMMLSLVMMLLEMLMNEGGGAASDAGAAPAGGGAPADSGGGGGSAPVGGGGAAAPSESLFPPETPAEPPLAAGGNTPVSAEPPVADNPLPVTEEPPVREPAPITKPIESSSFKGNGKVNDADNVDKTKTDINVNEDGSLNLLKDKNIGVDATQKDISKALGSDKPVFVTDAVDVDLSGQKLSMNANGEPMFDGKVLKKGDSVVAKDGTKISWDGKVLKADEANDNEYNLAVTRDGLGKEKWLDTTVTTTEKGVDSDGVKPTGILGEGFDEDADKRTELKREVGDYKKPTDSTKPAEVSKALDTVNTAVSKAADQKAEVVEPAKAEPAKAEPAKAEPAKAEPAKAEPAKAEPAKAEPAKAEPAKAEPAKAEPAKAQPVVPKLNKPATAPATSTASTATVAQAAAAKAPAAKAPAPKPAAKK